MDQPELNLSTIQFEQGLEILAELNQPALFQLIDTLDGNGSDVGAFQAVFDLLKCVNRGKLLRRLAAVVNATADQQAAADEDPMVWDSLAKVQALRPLEETVGDAKRFFTGLGIFDLGTLASWAQKLKEKKPGQDLGQVGELPPSEG